MKPTELAKILGVTNIHVYSQISRTETYRGIKVLRSSNSREVCFNDAEVEQWIWDEFHRVAAKWEGILDRLTDYQKEVE